MKSFKSNAPIPLALIGCDFRRASTPFREVLVTTPETRKELYQALSQIDPEAGIVFLETCNRIEWIVTAEESQWIADLLKAQLLNQWKKAFPQVVDLPEPYVFTGIDALDHLFRVVVGMESLAKGEAQIAGQFQSAVNKAREEEASSPLLNRLSSVAGRLAKATFRLGFRSNQRQGIHGLTACYLESQLEKQEQEPPYQVLVVGMGSIGRKAAQLLAGRPNIQIIRMNRTIPPEQKGHWHPLSELPERTRTAHAVIMATGSLDPVLTPQRMGEREEDRPLLIVDIGIPRQVERSLREGKLVSYRTIDELYAYFQSSAVTEASSRIRRNVEAELEKEIERFAIFCTQRHMTRLLECIHLGRRRYVVEEIPAMVSSEFEELDERERQKISEAMRLLLNKYAHSIHDALEQSLTSYWSKS